MRLATGFLYHIYNRGNNQQPIFLQERNYHFFIQKVAKAFSDQVDLLAFCLMPNHFHFLISTRDSFDQAKFSGNLRVLLSSYTRAIQKQEGFTGSLFQQNTKAKELTTNEYARACFHYIHQNPIRARLVDRIEDWPYHSFKDYWKGVPGICNTELGRSLIDLPDDEDQFYRDTVSSLDAGLETVIF